MRPLWESTRDLHHACEEHLVGAAMSRGDPPVQWYAHWVMALFQIHNVLDKHLPECVRRRSRLLDDMSKLAGRDVEFEPLVCAAEYAQSLDNEKRRAGAAYVLTGAHLMGGEIMRRRLEGYPTNHLEWTDRKAALKVLKDYRHRDNTTNEARDCFSALLGVMDEIVGG